MAMAYLFLLAVMAHLRCGGAASEIKAPALFIFGDSTVDVGNNNVLDTLPLFKVDHPPYGHRFSGKPTGRFGDGRIIVDYLAEHAGLPPIPAYANKQADFTHGANFASGGAGVLSHTNQGMVTDLKTQLAQFEELHGVLTRKLGPAEEAKQLFEEAVYLTSVGSNDYMGGYLGNPEMQKMYEPQQYVSMVVGNFTESVSFLYSKGARKVVYLGLAPLGCLPALRMLSQSEGGGCLEVASALSQAHNQAMITALKYLQAHLADLTIVYGNFFDFVIKRMDDPKAYGFEEGVKACCGSGRYGGEFNCGSEVNTYEQCSDSRKWVYWDSFHPSEHVHEQFAEAVWAGSSSAQGEGEVVISPFALRELFSSSCASLHHHHHHHHHQESEGLFLPTDVTASLQTSPM